MVTFPANSKMHSALPVFLVLSFNLYQPFTVATSLCGARFPPLRIRPLTVLSSLFLDFSLTLDLRMTFIYFYITLTPTPNPSVPEQVARVHSFKIINKTKLNLHFIKKVPGPN